ncbi:hypothetical protein M3B43_04995 [Nesterenkonia massiliensis]|uniref:Uncharacterized protein n=1 Tax=Nesterenkonia massiliensis TaxID=1232429 RepID=A0ABT2HPU2_9MICC|nr:hypothetical protein [Nesterenkonia massiliensis]MCT1606693.1 hypothetical protein [Nesterenkonia massiliensis]
MASGPFLLPLTAASQVGAMAADAPTWAPIVFAAGAFAVIILVLILMRQKLKQSDSWLRDSERPGDNDPGSGRSDAEGDAEDHRPGEETR